MEPLQNLINEAINVADRLCHESAGRQEIADVIEWNDIAQQLAGISNRIMRIKMDRDAIANHPLPF